MNLTTSSIFLLRGLGLLKTTETISDSRIVTELGFLNAYLSDSNHVSYLDHPLYLLFKPTNLTSFSEFLEGEYDVNIVKEDYDYVGGYVMLLYDFPKEYIGDYDLILEGRYSEVSKKYKDLFPDTYLHQGRKTYTKTYHIFNKTNEYREELEEDLSLDNGQLIGMELHSVPDKKREMFNIENLIENATINTN